MKIKYRRIKKEDIGGLQKFYKENGMNNAGSISNNFLLKCAVSELKNYILFFVAEYKKEIIGAVYFVDQGGLITVWSAVVDKNYRRQGIATKLVEKGLEIVNKKKRSMISAIVDPANTPSIGICRKLGFTAERTRVRMDKVRRS